MALSAACPKRREISVQDQFTCPYCEAALNRGVLSCRNCGRDLTPVLPLLRRLDALEERLAAAEKRAEEERAALATPRPLEPLRAIAVDPS